jgi:hypothetical protein
LDRGNPFQEIRKKKKRYVYFVGENVRNVQTDARDNSIVGSRFFNIKYKKPMSQ